eukprot:1938628-Pleurochrysis_carterae.AAC.3
MSQKCGRHACMGPKEAAGSRIVASSRANSLHLRNRICGNVPRPARWLQCTTAMECVGKVRAGGKIELRVASAARVCRDLCERAG